MNVHTIPSTCFLDFTHLKWNQWLQRSHSLMSGGFQPQSWNCLCIFLADLVFRPWHIPQDTYHAEDSFRRHQTHPYFPSWEMSGCKLTHFIVSVWRHFIFPWQVQVHGTSCRDHRTSKWVCSTLYLDVWWGVTVPPGESLHPQGSMTGESFSLGSHSSLWQRC